MVEIFKILLTTLIIICFSGVFGLYYYQLYLFYKMMDFRNKDKRSFLKFQLFLNFYWWDDELDIILNMIAIQPIFYLFLAKDHYPKSSHDIYEKRKKVSQLMLSLIFVLIVVV